MKRVRLQVGSRLNNLVKEVSEEHGFHFLDAQKDAGFAGHNRCSTKRNWINAARFPRGQGSLHSNNVGYARLAKALAVRIKTLSNSTPRKRNGLVDLVGSLGASQ